MGDLEQIDGHWEQVIKKGKNEQFDFIENVESEIELLRIVSAFANTEGGNLLIGVNQKSKIKGVSPEGVIATSKELLKKNSLINLVQFHTIYISHFILVAIEVEKSKGKIFIKEGFKRKYYIRIDANTCLANKVIIRYWRMKEIVNKTDCIQKNTKELLNAFLSSRQFSLAQLYKEINLSNKEIDMALSCLLFWDEIDLTAKDNRILYKIKERHKKG